jgi:hypothetical protein
MENNQAITYSIQYGELAVNYRMECDGESNNAVIIGFNGKWFGDDFDNRDIADIKFHCESDFRKCVWDHYLKTGENL